jgi:hypothetical protein
MGSCLAWLPLTLALIPQNPHSLRLYIPHRLILKSISLAKFMERKLLHFETWSQMIHHSLEGCKDDMKKEVGNIRVLEFELLVHHLSKCETCCPIHFSFQNHFLLSNWISNHKNYSKFNISNMLDLRISKSPSLNPTH